MERERKEKETLGGDAKKVRGPQARRKKKERNSRSAAHSARLVLAWYA